MLVTMGPKEKYYKHASKTVKVKCRVCQEMVLEQNYGRHLSRNHQDENSFGIFSVVEANQGYRSYSLRADNIFVHYPINANTCKDS